MASNAFGTITKARHCTEGLKQAQPSSTWICLFIYGVTCFALHHPKRSVLSFLTGSVVQIVGPHDSGSASCAH